jgi:hypothetical protein
VFDASNGVVEMYSVFCMSNVERLWGKLDSWFYVSGGLLDMAGFVEGLMLGSKERVHKD